MHDSTNHKRRFSHRMHRLPIPSRFFETWPTAFTGLFLLSYDYPSDESAVSTVGSRSTRGTQQLIIPLHTPRANRFDDRGTSACRGSVPKRVRAYDIVPIGFGKGRVGAASRSGRSPSRIPRRSNAAPSTPQQSPATCG